LQTKKSILQLQLLKELLEGKKVCLKTFSSKFDISLRSAQRYMQDLIEVFGDNILKDSELYSFVSHSILDKNILNFNKKELENFVDLYSLLDFDFSTKLDDKNRTILKKMEKKYSSTYLIKQNPFENFLQKKELLFQIKDAIKNRRYAKIEYTSDKKYIFDQAKILKIVFAEGNFYIAALTPDDINSGFKFLRLSFVDKIDLYATTFKKEYEAEDFLKKFQTLFSNYKKEPFEVVLKIDESVKRFFINKKFLSSQTILENKDDLIVSFKVTNSMEILPLVKKWLPNIKIVSPKEIKEQFEEELREYLK